VATFVLIHGAWQGAWAWRHLISPLEADGHRVIAPDLPGHGGDIADPAQMTLEAYARRVQDSVASADEPVVLVGHSMGGMPVTQAAEFVPESIAQIVYVAAYVPVDGQSLADISRSGSEPDPVLPHIEVDRATGTSTVAAAARRTLFYGECSDEDVAVANARSGRESLAAMTAAAHLVRGDARRLPRAYIECLRDGAIPLGLQRQIQRSTGCGPVLSLDTDHCPFLSRPGELADQLQKFV
jgi:pimeloyl-ACP methyl ester carboxylesterase